ncbi:hypothetical protein MBLNU230_g6198t1 [Neophaeotheca triangularis]
MSHEERASWNIPVPASASPVPRPPPLPAPRPLQRARDAANRFFGYPSRPTSPQDDYERDKGRLTRATPSRYATLGATQNATASHKTGLEINTIAINEKGTHALLGGKEIFKTVKVEDGVCAEDLNLRTAIRSAPKQASGAPRQVYSIDIADVAWAKGDCGDYVAAATSSGKIILWNIGLAGLPAVQLHEHFRQVHKVTFNPHRGNLLLSGSQDGTVRLWDLRDIRHQASQLQSKRKYSGQSDGVRDVKWSPTDGVDFAFGTDSGWIQRWDIRNLKTAKVKIPAHTTTCNSIDWHPDGRHLASASSDKTVRVWDVSTGRRQQKAGWEIKTPHPVLNARWRPACESSVLTDNGARICTQVVTSYSREIPTLHVWDFRRPALPFREMAPHHSAPTDMLWHSQDLLWTVGREGKFSQSDVQHAPKTIEKRHLQAFAISPQGDLNFITQRRRRRRRPSQNQPSSLPTKSYSAGHSPEQGALSRSWADDSLDQTFLSFSNPKHRVRSAGSSRAPSISQTPPQNDTGRVPIVKLDDVLSNRKSTRPQQYASRGRLPTAPTLVSSNKFETLTLLTGDNQDILNYVERAFIHNALQAEEAGLYRLAQTWRIVCFAATTHLRLRAEARRKDRLEGKLRFSKRPLEGSITVPAHDLHGVNDRSALPSPESAHPPRAASILSKQLAGPESTSNTTTPQAKPFPNGNVSAFAPQRELEDPDKSEKFSLPSSVTAQATTARTDSKPQTDHRLTAKNLTDLQKPQWTDGTTSGAHAIRRWSVQPKVPLSLDPVDAAGNKIPPKLEHHDSDDSFSFLEGSLDSRGPSFPGSFASNHSPEHRMPAERPSRPLPRVAATDGTGLHHKLEKSKHEATEDGNSPGIAFKNPFERKLSTVADDDADGELVDSNHEDKFQAAPGSTSKLSADFIKHGKRNSVSDIALMELEAPKTKLRLSDDAFESRKLSSGFDRWQDETTKASIDRESRISKSQELIPSDFQTHPEDNDVEQDKPFTLVSMLRELIAHYSNNDSDAQTASNLLLQLAPLLPETHSLPHREKTLTTNHYSFAFANTGFSRHEIPSLLSKTLSHLLNAGLQPLQLELILSTYHDQLLSHRLFLPATALRQSTYPAYPAVYEQALKDNFLAFQCSGCGKAIEPSPTAARSKPQCESCNIPRAPPCAVCWCEESPFTSSALKSDQRVNRLLFSTCLLCNHTSHTTCLETWFATTSREPVDRPSPADSSNDLANNNDGASTDPPDTATATATATDDDDADACPTEGCLCACVPGLWRERKEAERIAALRRPGLGQRGKIRSDEWGVRESRAVARTRGVLAATTAPGGRGSV